MKIGEILFTNYDTHSQKKSTQCFAYSWPVGKYTVYECSEAQTELAIVYTKVLNLGYSIIHSFEGATVKIPLSFRNFVYFFYPSYKYSLFSGKCWL